MENKLDIRKDPPGKEQRIYLEGRLDASWAGHLDDYLNGLVRDGAHRLILNMSGVQYMSSAGIRTLVVHHKKLKKIGGLFVLEELSPGVAEVLEMVGMISMLTEGEKEAPVVVKEKSNFLEVGQYRFENEVLSDGMMTLSLTGNPALSMTSGFTAEDNQKFKFKSSQYGLGIGAIGNGFEDCRSRYGEFLAIGEALFYKPSDKSRIPDYMLKTGKLEPEINALYAIRAEGAFANRIIFEPIADNSFIAISALVSGLAASSGLKQFLFLVIGESDGLVGASLNTPPVDGNPLFDFPGIRENIHFTTEPAYSKMLSVSLGICSIDPDETLRPFLRPDKPGSTSFIHVHSAVFPYQSLPKNEKSANKLVLHLFETSHVMDVLHLINDSREIAGIGESIFKQGVAWIGNLSK